MSISNSTSSLRRRASPTEILELRIAPAFLGPDASGHFADTDASSTFEDISTTGAPILDDFDDEAALVDLNFNFEFYGGTYAQVYVSTNGLLTFGSPNEEYSNTNLLTSSEPSQPAIAVLWDDFFTTGSGDAIYVQTLGVAGDDLRTIIHWHDVRAGSATVDFEAVLFEGGAVELRYNDVTRVTPGDAAESATIGFRAGEPNAINDGNVLQVSYNEAGITDGQTIRFSTGQSLFALTTDDHLLRVNSNGMGNVESDLAITGLAAGEHLLGIDVRPSDGLLYGASTLGKFYKINTVTGAAAGIGAGLGILSSGDYGFDFNPAADKLRLVNDSRENRRIDPNTGTVIASDAALAYDTGDVNEGASPSITGLAYTNNVPGAPATTLYGIDSTLDVLVMQGGIDGNPSPNGGKLTTVGGLGVDTTGAVGFDIADDGHAFASLTTVNAGVSHLYRLDLATGAATDLGEIGGGRVIQDIAVPTRGVVEFTGATYTVVEGQAFAELTLQRTGGTFSSISVDFAAADGSATVGQDYFATTKTVSFAPGQTTAKVRVLLYDDARDEGDETIAVSLSGLLAGAQRTATLTIQDDHMAPVLHIRNATGGENADFMLFEVYLTTPSSDAINVNYELLSGTALLDVDFSSATSIVSFNPGELSAFALVTLLDDINAEGTETFAVNLSSSDNARLVTGADQAVGTILDNEVKLVNATTAQFTDQDGDLVTVKLTKGTLTQADFTLVDGHDHGFQLASLNLANHTTFDGTGVSITAKPTAAGGDGFVNVGYLNATGIDLGAVTIGGDLGRVDAGNANVNPVMSPGLLSLTAQSMGRFGTDTQDQTDVAISLQSHIVGKLGKLTTKTSIEEASIDVTGGATPASGAIGAISIGGSLRGTGAADSGSIHSTGSIASVLVMRDVVGFGQPGSGTISSGANIGPVTIKGSLLGDSGDSSGAILATGPSSTITSVSIGGHVDDGLVRANKVGAFTVIRDFDGLLQAGSGGITSVMINGDLEGRIITSARGAIGAVTVKGTLDGSVRSDSTLGSVTIGQDLTGELTAAGLANPGTVARALAIRQVTISGDMFGGLIAAGVSPSGAGVNPDVQIGPVKITGDFFDSRITAGIDLATDQSGRTTFGGRTAPRTGFTDATSILSRIVSIQIGGQASGAFNDEFGFAAQQIGSLKLGVTPIKLNTGLDDFHFGQGNSVRLVEFPTVPI